ncbi:MAG: MotA/TolQ/ExbB proton channel family protein [Zetaproteobacteria bacterium]|nr:MotA/TolQ/ExbB proton channel family protein [Zetaproteobacteria bacterium]
MNIVEVLTNFSLMGAEWILWLLIILSVVSLGVIFERVFFYRKLQFDFHTFSQSLEKYLDAGEQAKARELCQASEANSVEAKVALKGLETWSRGAKGMTEAMEGFAVTERQILDRGLVFLATLGNNAPFIGLFGTVIGIIQAFHDLAANPDGGASVVMASISEALVATAVGLLVAIPAVVAFNLFNRWVKKKMTNAEATIRLLSSFADGGIHQK